MYLYCLFQAEAYMTLREWGKAERLLRNVLETDSGLEAVALYHLSQVLTCTRISSRGRSKLHCFFHLIQHAIRTLTSPPVLV